METRIRGLHHVTAIAGDARRNHDFYTRTLGLRLVKKTVNFDDPHTYHFYFGNATGAPGTLLTFFPWHDVPPGRLGVGQATATAFVVPPGSLGFWTDRLAAAGVVHQAPARRFDPDPEHYLTLSDPDGTQLELVARADDRPPHATADIAADYALRGFSGVTLTLRDHAPTARLLTEVFGYRADRQQDNRHRFVTDAVAQADVIDLVQLPTEPSGRVAGGSVHHVAFRVRDEAEQMAFRERLLARGLHVTEQIDRQYFKSLYFREPGGVLFEIATDTPGFAVDEAPDALGTHLVLPPRYEPRRAEIEQALPPLH